MSARISVIVATCNHEAFLAEALDSVLGQSVIDDVEIIITNDGSSDGTKAVIERYVAAHPARIQAIFSLQTLRSTEVLGRAVRAASGEFIACLEGGDYWTDPDKLAKQMALLDADPQMTMCYHNATHVGPEGASPPRSHLPPGAKAIELRDLMLTNPIPASSVFYRASAITPLPAWMDVAPCRDWPLHLLAALEGGIGYLPEPMAACRKHAGGSETDLSWSERYGSLTTWFDFLHKVMPQEHHGSINAATAYLTVAARIHEEDVAGAVNALHEAAALDPDVGRYFVLFTALIGTRGEATALLGLIATVAPNRGDHYAKASACFAQLGFVDECREALQSALLALGDGAEHTPDEQIASDFGCIGRYLREEKHFVDAEAALRQAVAFAPEADGPRGQLANLLVDRNRIDEAVPLLKKAIALNGTEVRYRLRLSGLYHRMQDFAAEEALLKDAIALAPQRADIAFRLASAQLLQGHTAEGAAALRLCLELEPSHERAKQRLKRLSAVESARSA